MFVLVRLILFTIALWLCWGGQVWAAGVEVSVTGRFVEETDQFQGEARYRFSDAVAGLWFHLPPNHYLGRDDRNRYLLRNPQGKPEWVPRSQLSILGIYRPRDPNQAQGIEIQEVLVQGNAVPYLITDNPQIWPMLVPQGGLLHIPLAQNGETEVVIRFSTQFQKLPLGWKRLLYDFVPRPLPLWQESPDFADAAPQATPYRFEVEYQPEEGPSRSITFADHLKKPFVFLGHFAHEGPGYRIGMDDYLANREPFFNERVETTLNFMLQNQWLTLPAEGLQVVIWNGPTLADGRTLFVPRSLFRYLWIYRNRLEFELVRGFAHLGMARHRIEARRYPWLLPAIASEALKDYVAQTYQGDYTYFPWLDWINPSYQDEEIYVPWLEAGLTYHVTGADEPLEQDLYAQNYHPYFAKAYSLFPVLYDGQGSYQTAVTERLRQVVRAQGELTLDDAWVYQTFSSGTERTDLARLWLSAQGSIDLELGEVNIEETPTGATVQWQAKSRGSVHPFYEVEFTGAEGQKRVLLRRGDTAESILLDFVPIEVALDPQRHFLDSNLLNNRWQLPVKARPIFDIAGADRWLFTVYPLAESNTFDRNLFGIAYNLSYLKRTTLEVRTWGRCANPLPDWASCDVLGGADLMHKGWPWVGTSLYMSISQLGAKDLLSLGVLHEYDAINPLAWVDLSIWAEHLREEQQATKAVVDWQGINLMGEFPLYRSASLRWIGGSELSQALGQRLGGSDETPWYQKTSLTQKLTYWVEPYQWDFTLRRDFSFGQTPVQQQFPIGGIDGLPGFPAERELLFLQRSIASLGLYLPPTLENQDFNLMRLFWALRARPGIIVHYGQGWDEAYTQMRDFKDIEFAFEVDTEYLTQSSKAAQVSVAVPLGSEEYKGYRVILFSSWVF